MSMDGQLAFDFEAGRAGRDAGAEAAGLASPTAEAWRSSANDAMAFLARGPRAFTAEDLYELAGLPPVPNMAGGVFLRWAKAGKIEHVGYARAKRAVGHAHSLKSWRGARHV